MSMLAILTVVSALGAGLVAGLFFAFSTAVMKALRSLPPVHGIAAMRSINVVILNPLFLSIFLGTSLTCAVTAVMAVQAWTSDPGAIFRLAGSLLYLGGAFAVTILFNVPRNNALAAVAPGAGAERLWQDYLTTWTAWNHVRTAAAAAAALLLTMALSAAGS
jgi:uncharacterized membrane protein